MRPGLLLTVCLLPASLVAQSAEPVRIPLVLHPGTPIRLKIEKTVFPKHVGDEVRATLTESLYAFDTQVVPAGAHAVGHVTEFTAPSRNERILRYLSAKFGSFRRPQVHFDALLLPDGRSIPIHATTEDATGQEMQMKFAQDQHRGRMRGLFQSARRKADVQVQKVRTFFASPHKLDAARSIVLDKSPYQPVRIKQNARYDAVLTEAVSFGTRQVPLSALKSIGASSPEAGVIHAAVEQRLDSKVVQVGDPVEALVTQPLFAPDHRLILPEGSRLTGKVTTARRARFLHRNGRLRFAFTQVVLPQEVVAAQEQVLAAPVEKRQINGNITAMEVKRGSNLAVDNEGGPVVKDSVSRFIAPALTFAFTAAAGQKEEEGGSLQNRTNAQVGTGAMVLGVAGAVIGRTSHVGAMALGYTGTAESFYTHFIGRGSDIRIPRNTSLLIELGKVHQGPVLPTGPPSK